MSTEVGLKTQYLNWRENFPSNAGIEPTWITVNWWKEDGEIENLPLLPAGVKSRLRARMELREGFSKGPFDALLLASSVHLPGGNRLLEQQPFFILLDTTPKQMEDLSGIYEKRRSDIPFQQRRKEKQWRWRFQNARALFPWSQWAADSMIRDYGADPQKVHIIPPGIDLKKWKYISRDNAGNITHIFFVGGGFKRKGGDLLLRWAERTKARNWMLHMVTRDAVQPPCECVRIYNGMSPNDPELMELYRQADIFILPTLGDCYSLASMEAMATGLPVIVSAVGGIPDIIHEGETGFLVPPGDEEALAHRLEFLIANPELRKEMGDAARRDAEERYDAEKNVRMVVERMMREI